MFWLYCLPGKIFAAFGFLWPGAKQGNITATARRRDSRFAHFVYATVFWLGLAWYLTDGFSGSVRSVGNPATADAQSPAEAAEPPQAVPEELMQPDYATPAAAVEQNSSSVMESAPSSEPALTETPPVEAEASIEAVDAGNVSQP